jgi:hypothetical protein
MLLVCVFHVQVFMRRHVLIIKRNYQKITKSFGQRGWSLSPKFSRHQGW